MLIQKVIEGLKNNDTACLKKDALKYTERVGKPCKYIFNQLSVPSQCFLDCDYIAIRTALAVCLIRKVILLRRVMIWPLEDANRKKVIPNKRHP